MAEQLSNHEVEDNRNEDVEVAPANEKMLEATTETPEQEVQNVEAIRETVDKAETAVTPPELEIDNPKESVELPPPNKALKAQALNRTLKETRQKLPNHKEPSVRLFISRKSMLLVI